MSAQRFRGHRDAARTSGRKAAFSFELATALAPGEALGRVLDLRAHDRLIPFTRILPSPTGAELGAGQRFIARTGLRGLHFDDPMRVDLVDFGSTDPGRAAAVIVKEGRVIAGTIRVRVVRSGRGSELRWQQSVALPWLPSFAWPLAGQVLRLAYRTMVVRLLSDADGPVGRPGRRRL